MTTQLTHRAAADIEEAAARALEKVIIANDLANLTVAERVNYYMGLCASLQLNPLSRPFDYLILSNKLTLYANKNAAEQIRDRRGISARIVGREKIDDLLILTAEAVTRDGRVDQSLGVVSLAGVRGDALANAYMKAETKAKRRVTFSIASLGMLDETEVDSIPGARRVQVSEAGDLVLDAERPQIESPVLQRVRESAGSDDLYPPAETPDDADARGHFIGVAIGLGYVRESGKIDLTAVHRALTLPLEAGHLAAWVRAGRSWGEAEAWLIRVTRERQAAEADLSFEAADGDTETPSRDHVDLTTDGTACPACGGDWLGVAGAGWCAACGLQEAEPAYAAFVKGLQPPTEPPAPPASFAEMQAHTSPTLMPLGGDAVDGRRGRR